MKQRKVKVAHIDGSIEREHGADPNKPTQLKGVVVDLMSGKWKVLIIVGDAVVLIEKKRFIFF